MNGTNNEAFGRPGSPVFPGRPPFPGQPGFPGRPNPQRPGGNPGQNRPVSMNARILRVRCGDLLVRNEENGQEVLVHVEDACRFREGERVCIQYGGIMTMSIPPQISATRIYRGPCFRERG